MNQIEKIIDIATWNRKEHFEHFSAFDDPFFGVTVNVDCTRAYREAKNKGVSFSLLLLHRIITAAAKVEEFRYRIEGEKVVCYDSLLPEATVGRADHTFSFASFEYDPDELTFILKAKAEMERLHPYSQACSSSSALFTSDCPLPEEDINGFTTQGKPILAAAAFSSSNVLA